MLHIRARKGSANTSRGALRFIEELIPRVARAAAGRSCCARGLGVLEHENHGPAPARAGWTYSIGVRQQKHIKAAIAEIPEQDWQPLDDYPEGGKHRSRRGCSAHND